MSEGSSQRLTYAQLAEARGISKASAERLVRNRKWPRVLGNDGVAIVIVPPGEASPGSAPGSGDGQQGRRIRPGRPPRNPLNPLRDHARDPPLDFRGMIETAIAPIRELLTSANQRADRAEQRAEDERARADRAEQRSAAQATVITGLEGEQEGLWRHLNAAISAWRTAREEAMGLRAELDALRARSWWARLRNRAR